MPASPPRGAPTRVAMAGGAALALLTSLAMAACSGKAFGYDESVTVALFVRAPHLATTLRRQYVFNNHPYFSFLEHLVASTTHDSGEHVLRVLPIAVSALGVAALTTLIGRRMGLVPGVAAGLVLATNPLFDSEGFQVRGYGILVLATIALGAAVLDQLPGRWTSAATAGAIGLGLGTHLYMVPVIGLAVLVLIERRQLDRTWCTRLALGLVVGALPHVLMVDDLRHTGQRAERSWGFLLDLGRAVLGGPPLAVAALGATVALALVGVRGWLRRPTVLVAVAGLGACLIASPVGAPRFFIWMVPAVALAAAAAVARWRPAALLVVVAAAASVVHQAPTWREDTLANRQAAPYLAQAVGSGGLACAIGESNETLPVYIATFQKVATPAELDGCTVAVALQPALEPAVVAAARARFAQVVQLTAATPGLVFTQPRG